MKAVKKIAILHPQLEKVWWAVKMMVFLWNFLKEKWYEVTFFTNSYKENLFETNFEIKVLWKMKISYEVRKYDLLIIWNSPMHFVWVLSKILFFSKVKIIWWHHHYPWYHSGEKGFIIFLKKFLEKKISKKIDVMVWNSFYIQKSLFEIFWVKAKILNPVLDKEFLNYEKNIIENSSETIILTYSRWVKWKNAKQIFDTYEFLKNNFQNLKLFIWWEGEELKFYKTKYKGNKNIEFLWQLNKDSIISYLEKSNLFLFPSKIDSFWISALESIFIWVPVVAFNEKWVVEIIKNWYNWFLVENDSEFNRKIFEVLNDEKINLSLSEWCIETRKNFSYQRFEKQLENIFLKLRG